ncbi:aldolase catalytic domain-containing protein [Clostridium sp. M62/1]|uniref:aldolase catalytic domain-containing protein n=1 Tax=Clostridium sp. M62/1 TaxID=411486 RepID=UPI0001972E3C|nr:aldolase catalytic domain-containing protein [Clostridium sp. M62/1]EFE11457.1 HMGL-like protein [Clostridium sp. M62/1]UEB77487.1 aldolase catalytic domain-containing protein [Clostridium sp. M62/1]
MKNIHVLDCTLRDGGRIINCAFPDTEIKDISVRLARAKIDIVEVGFLRDWRKVKYEGNSTFFTNVDQIRPFIDKRQKGTMFVAFIDYGMFDFESLTPYDGTSIDGIRFGFTKKDYTEHCDDILKCIERIKNLGYKLFIQGVNSLNYSDKELLELVELVNRAKPYSFGIVDTYGAMYADDVERIYRLIDHNMDPDICINFHSHNNYQLSFSFAQEVIKLSRGIRNVIIDSTLSGMGKVAGNLNTELLVDYLVRKKNYDYEFDEILDLIDDYIVPYSLNYRWGYSIPAMMAGIYQSHPNNIIYLTEKFRLETKDISSLLSMLSPDLRQRYDYDLIEKLYMEYISDKVDDTDTVKQLQEIIEGREVFIMAPGNTLNTCRRKIENYLKKHHPIVISVNFVSEYKDSICFFGNQKRYNKTLEQHKGHKVIISSNVKCKEENTVIVNYHSLINRGYKYFENSTIMLLYLLKRLNPRKITIAGFDGFRTDADKNYTDITFQNERHISEFGQLNEEITEMFEKFVETMSGKCEVNLITPSIYNKTA